MANVLDCIDCGGEGTLTTTSTLIGCKLCGVLIGRCNGQWVQAKPPRRGIVEAMQRKIPSDAHLCGGCKLPYEGTRLGCASCWVLALTKVASDAFHRPRIIRHFRELGKGG